eukprot:2740678-Rhodomonas_salina.1
MQRHSTSLSRTPLLACCARAATCPGTCPSQASLSARAAAPDRDLTHVRVGPPQEPGGAAVTSDRASASCF